MTVVVADEPSDLRRSVVEHALAKPDGDVYTDVWIRSMLFDRFRLAHPELLRVFEGKYGSVREMMGWDPRTRFRFGYFSPEDHYEAVVSRAVTAGCAWLDVGCGRNVFPSNPRLARILADRCGVLVGVDPDATILENEFVHERIRQAIEDFHSEDLFDLVTLRMAAEHVVDPDRVVAALARLTKPGGQVIVYTINRWSPVPVITWLAPFSWHHFFKRLLWRTEAKDTFPVAYRMNTQRTLANIFGRHGFREIQFAYLDDCRTLSRFRATLVIELCLWRCFRALGLKYPENCLLGTYERL